jgi:hypothetical protein
MNLFTSELSRRNALELDSLRREIQCLKMAKTQVQYIYVDNSVHTNTVHYNSVNSNAVDCIRSTSPASVIGIAIIQSMGGRKSASSTRGYHFGATVALTAYTANPDWAANFAYSKEIVSEDMVALLVPSNYDSSKDGIRANRANAINMIVSKPAVKHFAKVFGNKLQLDERDFSITVDNAKDVFAQAMVERKLTKDWYLSTAFSTKIGEKQYRANDAFTKSFARIWVAHALLAKVERGLEDAALATIFDDL